MKLLYHSCLSHLLELLTVRDMFLHQFGNLEYRTVNQKVKDRYHPNYKFVKGLYKSKMRLLKVIIQLAQLYCLLGYYFFLLLSLPLVFHFPLGKVDHILLLISANNNNNNTHAICSCLTYIQ